MTTIIKTLIVVIAIGFTACSSKSEVALSETSKSGITSELSEESSAKTSVATEISLAIERMLVKTAQVSYAVSNAKTEYTRVEKLADTNGGFFFQEQFFNRVHRSGYTLVVKIPVAHFDSFLDSLTLGLDEIDSYNVNVDDVTAEFVDISARIKVKKELERRYINLLKQARSVGDVLEIEKQLAIVRCEIEGVQSRIKYLKKSSQMSTVNVTFFTNEYTEPTFGLGVANGLENGWDGFIFFLIFLTNIWPCLILIRVC